MIANLQRAAGLLGILMLKIHGHYSSAVFFSFARQIAFNALYSLVIELSASLTDSQSRRREEQQQGKLLGNASKMRAGKLDEQRIT